MKKRLFLLPLVAVLLSACGESKEQGNPPGPNIDPTPEHEHTFATEWTTTNTEHWHAPLCEHDVKSDLGTHIDNNNDGKCDVCEYVMYSPEIVHVESVTLNKDSIELVEGESETLTYTIAPQDAYNKNVSWSSDSPNIASVENGVVKAWNPGTARITITTEENNKTDYCDVVVSAKIPEKTLVKDEFALNEQGYSFDNKSLVNYPLSYMGYNLTFAVGGNTYNNQPTLIKAKNKHYEARIYWGNTMTITSSTNTLAKIEFDLGENDKGNTMTCSTGSIVDGAWVGEAKEIVFTISGTSGYKAFETFRFCYEGESEDDPEEVINLGEKSIAEVKQYIAEHPVNKNSFGNGVNENRYVTIKGYAMAKIDLIKYSAKFGLDVSEHGKVIMADETGYIGVATVVNNQGTSLWGKIGDHICKPTSKYIVTGYISEYLGNPELLVTSFAWDQNLDITLNVSDISEGVTTLKQFYEKSQNVNYNCAGHGYGEVITIKDLRCYYVEPDGQGKRYYNFTDGTSNIRVNAFNLSAGATEGKVYDVTGIISLKNLSPIIVAFEIKASLSTVDFDYESAASEITISGLKAIHGSQDDTTEKFPNVVAAYGNIYKTTGYMVAVEENGKLYVGISDSPRSTVITGKTNAMANYNVVLIKNENFWNTTETELYLFNPIYDDYLCEENPIEVYYVTRQLEYSEKKPMWQILLIPGFVESLYPVVD